MRKFFCYLLLGCGSEEKIAPKIGAINAMKADGTLDALIDKYIKNSTD